VGYRFGVGREAPLFTLPAHDGSKVTLKQYRGDWLVALVFVEGADCAARVADFNPSADQLWGMRCQVVGVVHAPLDTLEAAAAEASPAFVLVADEDADVARSYDAWDEAAGRARDYVALVDRSGKIVWTAGGGTAPVKAAELLAGLRTVAR
jgi:peroxiredoxin Q/BCP